MGRYKQIILFLILSLSCHFLFSQIPGSSDVYDNNDPEIPEENDTVYHSPRKAAVYSATLPGLGQIYNGKYWKVPIVYAGFATLGYFIHFNHVRFIEFKQAYIDYPDYKLDYPYPLSLEQIDRGIVFYKRYRDLSILGTIGFYLFQILDASVDAHLFDWNVSEDISLRIEPSLIPPSIANNASTFGLRACLLFQ